MGDMNLRDCLVYLDDIIIFSSTFEEHIDRLTAVFFRLQEHNLKLKASKCEFMMSQVINLGHIVSQEGIQTDPEKTSAIWDWPVPQNIKDVRSFLGFMGYYRRFIQNFARIARPLNDLLIGHGTFKKKIAIRGDGKSPDQKVIDMQLQAANLVYIFDVIILSVTANKSGRLTVETSFLPLNSSKGGTLKYKP